MRPYFDVAVVGAGPAGSCAATELCLRGFAVAIIESKKTPGVPVRCGELLRPSLIESADVSPALEIVSELSSYVIEGPFGSALEFSPLDGAVVIDRAHTDAALVQKARRAGAQGYLGRHVIDARKCDQGIRITALGDAGCLELDCHFVVCADGVGGRIGRLIRLTRALRARHLAVTASVRIKCKIEAHVARIFLDPRLAPGGYAWAFPSGTEAVSVGLGMNPTMANGISAVARLRALLERRFPNALHGAIVCGGIPAAPMPQRLVTDHGAVVGDAARLANPITGAGICCAINSGTRAGRSVLHDTAYETEFGEQMQRLNELSGRWRRIIDAASGDALESAVRRASRAPGPKPSVAGVFGSIVRELQS